MDNGTRDHVVARGEARNYIITRFENTNKKQERILLYRPIVSKEPKY